MVNALSSGQKLAAMWKKLTTKQRNCDLDKYTLNMIEEGIRQVAQTGFPHNELESEVWKAELQRFTAVPTDIPEEIIHSNHLWKLRNGKATGEDGWCEEWLGSLRILCTESRADLDNLLRLIGKYAVLPRHHRGSLVKPVLKPGKQGHTHNEFRKLSLMSVVRKQVEKLGSVLMKPFWTSGAYQGGFKPHKRTTGRIFILLATISTALSPVMGVEPGNGECGLLLVDFEQFFDTLRQERLFHKMQTVGIPAHVIMLWKELAQTHSVKVVSNTARGESIKVLVGVPQGSGWSPELAALYVDVGLAQNLQNLRTGVVELPGGIHVHLLMFANDLFTANLTTEVYKSSLT